MAYSAFQVEPRTARFFLQSELYSILADSERFPSCPPGRSGTFRKLTTINQRPILPACDSEPCDVLIIGGGPGGSTAAALIADKGKDVVLLEKDAHPRFHIGESLLPRNIPILERLGILEEVASMGVLKPGAEFVSDETGESVEFNFAKGLDQEYTHAYQVKRADFDEALFANARRKGARTYERTVVTDVVFGAAGERARVSAKNSDSQPRVFAPKLVLDASGRETFLATRLRLIMSEQAQFHRRRLRTLSQSRIQDRQHGGGHHRPSGQGRMVLDDSASRQYNERRFCR